jgi:putative transcriptional regulator
MIMEDQMKDDDFNQLLKSVGEAAAFLNGEDVPGIRVHIPAEIDTKAIRAKLGMTQEGFAKRHGFSVGAVRDWEQGRSTPDRSTRAFLKVIGYEPEAVERALVRA